MDIPSLFMIPSAVSSGKVHSVFPNSTDADFDFNRDSDATRVNSEGLIERVGYYGSELVTNGDFSNGTNNWSFTDANGQVGSYFSRNEVCEIDFTNTSTIYASQSSILSNSKSYKITLDYYIPSTNASANYIQVRLGTTSSTSALTPNLDVLDNWTSVTLYGVSNGTDLYIYTPSGAIGDKFYIDNVSVKEITGDRARLNYEIEGGLVNTKPSLLLEPQSTNLITYSENFSDSSWTITGASIITNNAISPDGTLNATKLVENNSNSQHKIQETSNSIVAGNVVYSQFVKKGERNKVLLELGGGGGGSAKFNLDLGVVISESNVNATITKFSNNWYRCSVSFTSSSSSVYLGTYILDDTESLSYQGDGSSGLYIFGAQLEQLSYATSYIPTNGSTQTRAAETCNGAGTSSIFESSEGILYAEIQGLNNGTNQRWIALGSGSNANRVSIHFNSTNNISCSVRGTSSARYDANFNIGSQTNNTKAAIRYKDSNYSFFVNGVKVDSQQSNSLNFNASLSELAFDSADGASYFYGKCRDIRVYNTKEMTDSEVDILLTKITS